MSKFKTSVVMCTYNGEKYVEEQLNSIINQTVIPGEIIIQDDCSTDNTEKIILNFIKENNKKISIIFDKNEKNLGYFKNFEKAIKKAKNDIIFLSDQDDVWIDNKIEKILDQFYKDENIGFVFSNAYLVNSKLEKLNHDFWKGKKFSNKISKQLKILLKQNVVTGATMAFKKEFSHLFLPFPKEGVHDYWISLVLVSNNIPGLFIDKKLIYYRQHENNAIGGIKKKKKIRERLVKNPNAFLRDIKMFKHLYEKTKNKKIKNKIILLSFRNNLNNSNSFSLYLLYFFLINIFNLNYLKYSSGFKQIFKDLYLILFKRNEKNV